MSRLLPYVVLLLLFLPPVLVEAQIGNEVRILHVDTQNFPSVNVHVRAFCGGQQVGIGNQLTVRIYENGQLRTLQSLTCPQQTVPMSVALVLDRSGSVAGTSIFRIRDAAWKFVEMFQHHTTGSDEGAIFSFGDNVTMHQGMTSNIALLFDAIRNIYPYGVTTMFDAVIAGINEVAANASNPIKAVVLLSDGADNNSIATANDVIIRSQNTGIPVYCLGLSYVDEQSDLDVMRMIADQTGGMYIELNHPDDIVPAFTSIMSLITGGANDCRMNYTSDCPDGSMRELRVIAEACGVADTAEVRFRTPHHPSVPDIKVSFDSTFAYAGGEMRIPVMIEGPAGATLNHLNFKVLERAPLQYKGIVTTGYVAEKMTAIFGRVVDSVICELTGPLALSGNRDTLLVLRYSTPGTLTKDTSFVYPAFFLDKTTVECLRLLARTTNVAILQRPKLSAVCEDTLRITWDRNEGRYNNGYFRVSVTVRNPGVLTAKNTRVRIDVPDGVELISPSNEIYLSATELPVGATEYASFDLRMLPADRERRLSICVEVQPDSGQITRCCTEVLVEKAYPKLRVECDFINRIEWSDSLNSFVPDRFPVRVLVTNHSDLAARDVAAWIHVPQGFVVDSTTPVNTFVAPGTLTRNDSGYVLWYVRPLERTTSDLLRFCIKVAVGGDTAECCQELFITASPVRARMLCTDTRVVRFDDGSGNYDPAYLFISTTVRNVSALNMTGARAHIQLPSFARLGSSDFASKDFPNGAVILPGDSGVVMWVVELRGQPVLPSSICVNVTAENFAGAQCCTPLDVIVDNAIPSLACTVEGPDTVRYIDGAYDPNPMTVRVRVTNNGTTPAKGVTAALLQGEDLSIDGSDQPFKLLSDSLAAGASVEGSFRLRVLDRDNARHDTVKITVFAANGGGTLCAKRMFIEAVKGPVLELACAGPDSLHFVDSLAGYMPEPFLVSVDVRNIGTALADSVVAEILPPPDMTMATGEQAAKMLLPSTLAVGEAGNARWWLRATPRSVARMDTVLVQVKAKGKTLQQTAPCPVEIHIPAARMPQLRLSCELLKQAGEDDTVVISAVLRNVGSASAYQGNLRIEVPQRLRLTDETPLPVIDVGVLAPGAQFTATWKAVVQRGMQVDSVAVCIESAARGLAPERCCTMVRIPALEEASFDVQCALDMDTLRVDEQSGLYPLLTVSARIGNPSPVMLDSVVATLQLPQGAQLESGEQLDIVLRNIAAGTSANAIWHVRMLVDTATVPRSRIFRVRAYAGGDLQQCTASVTLMPAPPQPTGFVVRCDAPDTLWFIGASQGYRPAPFSFTVEIQNTGSTTLRGIRATLSLPSIASVEAGESYTKPLGVDLAPGEIATIGWLLRAAPQSASTILRPVVTVTADAASSRQCGSDILLHHPPIVDSASLAIDCDIPDTIRYDVGSDTYVPSPFTVTVRIHNNANRTLTGISGMLMLPANITLNTGETPVKVLGVDLQPGATGVLSFTCVPSGGDDDVLSTIRCIVNSDQTSSVECAQSILVQSRLLVVLLSMPQDIVGMMGREVTVPVRFSNPRRALLRRMSMRIDVDPAAVRILEVKKEGALAAGWPLTMNETATGVTIDGASGTPIVDDGVLFSLRCLLLPQQGRDGAFGVFRYPVLFAGTPDFGPGIAVVYSDGLITVSGDCIEPLKSDLFLRQNAPNPFNPVTAIEYVVSDALTGMPGVLEVLDMHGRVVRVLHDGPLHEGTHRVHFDGSALPSGVYITRLRSGSYVRMISMVLAK